MDEARQNAIEYALIAGVLVVGAVLATPMLTNLLVSGNWLGLAAGSTRSS